MLAGEASNSRDTTLAENDLGSLPQSTGSQHCTSPTGQACCRCGFQSAGGRASVRIYAALVADDVWETYNRSLQACNGPHCPFRVHDYSKPKATVVGSSGMVGSQSSTAAGNYRFMNVLINAGRGALNH